MRENRILCPLGNQLQEMGMSKGRRDSKDFLYRFTNSELLNPDEIEEIESKIGYQTFVKNENTIHFNSSQFFVKDSNIQDVGSYVWTPYLNIKSEYRNNYGFTNDEEYESVSVTYIDLDEL